MVECGSQNNAKDRCASADHTTPRIAMVSEKRAADGDADPGPAPKRPALSLEAIEKAKKALQLQKELKEKLKNLPQVTCAIPSPTSH